MKKVLSCLLVVLLLASLCTTAFATSKVSSAEPGPNPPVVVPPTEPEDDSDKGIVITDYADREKLSEYKQEQLELAYDALQDVAALVEGNEELKELLGDAEVDMESLFDISGDVDLPVPLTLELANPDNFAVMLRFVDGEPSVVKTHVEDELLTLNLEVYGAYAILAFVVAE